VPRHGRDRHQGREFDTHHDLKNCHNGVVDLRTGDLLPHDRDLMFTRMSGAPYLPGHRNADWDKALTAVAPDALEWFQTRIGQSITGHIPDDDALVVAEGGGENGKTGIMAAIREACGTYGDLISHRVLLSQPGQHPTELMDLRGLRFALLEETPEEGHLDTHRIKMTVGTPKIEARRMRRDPVVFDATHTMWVTTNHRLQVDTTDWATWRRLKLMIFPFKFLRPGQVPTKPNERVGDRTLRPKLFHDPDVHAAALAWAVEGAIRWYQNDRVMPRDPESVREATEKWRRESDVAYRFAVEKLVKGPNSFIAADDMKEQFLEFLQAEEKRPWTSQTINQRLPASLAAADMPAETDPTSPTKVRDGDQESRPEGRTSRGAKLVRMWRGVRFKTDVEVKAAEAEAARRHLKLMGS
jgi:P4 family phage/plasmid primase-like protien